MLMKHVMMGCATAAVTVGLMAGVAFADDVSGVNVKRLSGDTRYDTSAAICEEEAFVGMREDREQYNLALIVSGENFADALAASSISWASTLGYERPILLTDSHTLSPQTANQMKRIYPGRCTVVGGTSSVSEDVVHAAYNLCTYQTVARNATEDQVVERIAGNDRVGTSIEVLKETYAPETVILASGYNFADALSISPYSASKTAPIILASADGSLTDEAVSAINEKGTVKNIVIVGGENSVNENVKAQLGDAYQYTRLAGNDRYDTSAKVAQWEMEQGMTAEYAAIATGKNFPDALSGSVLSGSKSSILLLADEGKTSEAASVLSSKKGDIYTLYVYGGEGSVSNATVEAVLG